MHWKRCTGRIELVGASGIPKKKETIERLKLRVDEASNDNDRCVRLLSSLNRVFRVYDLSIILRKRTKRRIEGKIIFFRSLEPIETMFATKLDGHRSADCSLRAVMKKKCVVISCNFQYRLKSIRLAFLPIYKKARGCTWSAWSARATHRWRSPGWRTADRWIPRRRLPIISANTILRWWYRAQPRRIMATIRALRATMPPKRLARHRYWSMVRRNGHGFSSPTRK